jgi:large subunit ribosomal protein LP0
MHQIRVALRGKGVVLMGKNTMVRRALRTVLSENPQYERLLPHIKGNIGFVFTSNDLKEIRDVIVSNKVAAPARAGAFAPKDVTVPAGNTGMEPGKTSFFQALGIPTKIARGTIEIVSDIKVVIAGTRVGSSEATLLNMLNISPFTYGMAVVQIFDQGNAFAPTVLDVDEKELIDRFMSGIKTIAAISLALKYPTIASVTHSLVNSYKNLLAVALATEYTFEGAEKVRSFGLISNDNKSEDEQNYCTLKILSVPRMHAVTQSQNRPDGFVVFATFISSTILLTYTHFRPKNSLLTLMHSLLLLHQSQRPLPKLPRRKPNLPKRRQSPTTTW